VGGTLQTLNVRTQISNIGTGPANLGGERTFTVEATDDDPAFRYPFEKGIIYMLHQPLNQRRN